MLRKIESVSRPTSSRWKWEFKCLRKSKSRLKLEFSRRDSVRLTSLRRAGITSSIRDNWTKWETVNCMRTDKKWRLVTMSHGYKQLNLKISLKVLTCVPHRNLLKAVQNCSTPLPLMKPSVWTVSWRVNNKTPARWTTKIISRIRASIKTLQTIARGPLARLWLPAPPWANRRCSNTRSPKTIVNFYTTKRWGTGGLRIGICVKSKLISDKLSKSTNSYLMLTPTCTLKTTKEQTVRKKTFWLRKSNKSDST